MHVFERDHHYISVTHPGQIMEVTELPSGKTKVTKKTVHPEYYINLLNDGFVSEDCLLNAVFDEEMYKEFLPEGAANEDILGELATDIWVITGEVITAMIHTAAVSWHRLLHKNVVDGKVGYLSG